MIELKVPPFWYNTRPLKHKLYAWLLSPFGKLYGWFVKQRFSLYYPVPLEKPVICIGNLVTGGTGKTPVVMSLAVLLQEKGYNPHILTRGYGGDEEGPLQVSPGRDTAADVGDESLLLVEKAPTWVSRNRPLGAQEAIDCGANLIIMDDGFQNPVIYKDFSLVVVDGSSGFGNGRVMPAGPLRESLKEGIVRADAVLVIGNDKMNIIPEIKRYTDVPVLSARLVQDAGNPDLKDKKIFAFAGIGRPQKFRETLESAGAIIEGFGSYPDHFVYLEEDLKDLIRAAEQQGLPVFTTAKDYVRLPAAFKNKVQVYAVHLEWENPAQIVELIERTLQDRH